MRENTLDNIMENVALLPKVHRTAHRDIVKVALETLEEGLTRYHVEIIKVLDDFGTLHVAEIGDVLLVAKPQMTRLIDELINLGMVERQSDTEDRRKINITLTDKGTRALEAFIAAVRTRLRERLSCLSDEDLEDLSRCLIKLREIGSKLQDDCDC